MAARCRLARYVPRRGLVFYLEFDGVDAHAAGWHESAAYKLLVDTKLGALLEDLGVQTLDLVQASLPADRRAKGLDLVDVLKRVARGASWRASPAGRDRLERRGGVARR